MFMYARSFGGFGVAVFLGGFGHLQRTTSAVGFNTMGTGDHLGVVQRRGMVGGTTCPFAFKKNGQSFCSVSD